MALLWNWKFALCSSQSSDPLFCCWKKCDYISLLIISSEKIGPNLWTLQTFSPDTRSIYRGLVSNPHSWFPYFISQLTILTTILSVRLLLSLGKLTSKGHIKKLLMFKTFPETIGVWWSSQSALSCWRRSKKRQERGAGGLCCLPLGSPSPPVHLCTKVWRTLEKKCGQYSIG